MNVIGNLATAKGNCLTLMESIEDGTIDMILADLPYGVTRNKWDSVIDLDELWKQYKRIIKDNGAIVLFGQGIFSAKLILSNEKMFRYSLVWHKTNPSGFLNANRMPLRAHEDILVFYKKSPVYNPQKTDGHPRKSASAKNRRDAAQRINDKEHYSYGAQQLENIKDYDSTERFPTSILTFKKDIQKSALHPTQKPVALCEYLVRTYTDPGDTVLDNTMGSGTTLIAAYNTGRKAIGMELDDEIYKVAVDRISKHCCKL